MLPKRAYRISGISFLLIGTVLFLNTFASITGNAIIEDIQLKIGSFWALWFIAVGIALIVESRRHEFSGLEVFVSKTAIKRSEKDNKVRLNVPKYLQEVQMIVVDPTHRSQEVLGEFHVSPRGHKDIRVAWHYDKATNRLYVDDFLYHKKGNKYVDNWAEKAHRKEITRKSYEDAGYSSLAA